MLHFALTMGLLTVVAVLIGCGCLCWWMKKPLWAPLQPRVTPEVVWAGYVSWQFLNLYLLLLAGHYFVPPPKKHRSLAMSGES